MIVKRINDELYHHGVKGQRWGRRRYQNSDGTLTAQGRGRYDQPSSGRTKVTTGYSKGVHVRKGVLGQKESVSTYEDDKKYGLFNDHFQQKTAVSRRQANQSTAVKKSPTAEKKVDPYEELQKRINAKLDSQNAAFAKSETNVNNTNSAGNYSSMASLYSYGKDELEKEKRSAQYKQDALVLRLQNEARIKNSKKFLSKLKLFGEAYTEVHSENIEKGVNFVKKLFKRK